MSEPLLTFQELLGLSDAQVQEGFDSGRSLLLQKRYDDAVAVYAGLCTLCCERIDAWRGHAVALLGQKSFDDAVDVARSALELAAAQRLPDDVRAELHVIDMLALRGANDLDGARRAAARALSLGADDAPWRASIEQGHAELSRLAPPPPPDRAVGLVIARRLVDVVAGRTTLAYALGTSDAELQRLFAIGQTLLGQQQAERARRVFAGLVALDPTVAGFSFALGLCNALLGDDVAAGAAFDGAVNAARATPDGDDLLAAALVQRGLFRCGGNDSDAGVSDLQEALGLPAISAADSARATAALQGRQKPATATTPAAITPRGKS